MRLPGKLLVVVGGCGVFGCSAASWSHHRGVLVRARELVPLGHTGAFVVPGGSWLLGQDPGDPQDPLG